MSITVVFGAAENFTVFTIEMLHAGGRAGVAAWAGGGRWTGALEGGSEVITGACGVTRILTTCDGTPHYFTLCPIISADRNKAIYLSSLSSKLSNALSDMAYQIIINL